MTKAELRAANRRKQAALAARRHRADIYELRGFWCDRSLHEAAKIKLRKWLKDR